MKYMLHRLKYDVAIDIDPGSWAIALVLTVTEERDTQEGLNFRTPQSTLGSSLARWPGPASDHPNNLGGYQQ